MGMGVFVVSQSTVTVCEAADLFCNPPFIMHSANIRWGSALLVKASCKLQEFVQLMGPGTPLTEPRGASDVLDGATVLPAGAQVDPGDRPRLGGLLNKSALFWKPKCPSSSLETFYCHILFQTVLSRLRVGNPICSPLLSQNLVHICVRWMWGFLWVVGGNGHPSKITYHPEN